MSKKLFNTEYMPIVVIVNKDHTDFREIYALRPAGYSNKNTTTCLDIAKNAIDKVKKFYNENDVWDVYDSYIYQSMK